MKILNYTKEHEEFRARVHAFMEKEVKPCVDQWEKDKIMPRSAWKRMGAEGFLCTTVSREYGGPGCDFLHAVIVADELSRTNHNGAGPVTHSDIIVPYIETFATEECKRKYLPGCVSGDIITSVAMTEPNTGSDLSAIEATAEENGDEVVINGSKIFITNGINCDLAVVAAKNPEIENPYEAISLYLVETGTPGFEKGGKLDKMGWHSQDTAELFFTKCRIPVGNRLGEKGTGFKMLMQKLQQERIITAVWGIIAAEYVLDLGLELYRKNSGPGKPVPKSQVNQFELVELATEVEIGRTFVDKLIADHMEGLDIVKETSMAKFWITELARRVADRCMDLLGPAGVLDNDPIVRTWRDVRCMSIFAGTNEIMRQIVGKYMGL